MYYNWGEYQNLNNTKGLSFEQQWMKYNDIMNESAVSSSSAGAGAGAGGRHKKKSTDITFTFNAESVDDEIWFGVNSFDGSDILFNWGDGTSDVVEDNSGIGHSYSQPGVYRATMSNNVSYLQMSSNNGSNIYTTIDNGFRNAIHLTQLSMLTYLTNIIEGSLDNCPLTGIMFKFNNITGITSGMFSNIQTLEHMYFLENPPIESVESGSFALPNLNELYFYTSFTDGTLVDTIVNDLNGVLAHDGQMYSWTCRTSSTDDARSELLSRSFIVDCD